ncbi:MAG: S-layer protein, partial [Planctomycetaceae bacterium]|nr:S-layer protein [Planctomycetaceae bacterium]
MAVARASEVSNEPISFVNDIVPVLTKAGCNSGVCHAKAGGGQNGFELSLLGFEPLEDYDHMVLEGRGRRLFPAAPDQSLLLRKVSGRSPHGGGILLPPESKGYHLLRRWIVDGTPLGDTSVELRSLEVQPPHDRIQPNASRQLKAIAHYEDGSTRIVTELALFESNDRGMATVTGNGLVTASDL